MLVGGRQQLGMVLASSRNEDNARGVELRPTGRDFVSVASNPEAAETDSGRAVRTTEGRAINGCQ